MGLSKAIDDVPRFPTHQFTIPIDHFHNESRYEPHTTETFEALYKMDDTFYIPGGPVIVNTLGEDYLDAHWLQAGLLRDLAKATGGLAVVWGQRYYYGGDIVRSDSYTKENLRFHTREQALADLAYFSQHVEFPGLRDKNLAAPGTPWIIIGGSYAGQTSVFARIQYPDLFWQKLIDIANTIFASGNESAIQEFKGGFGAEDVASNNGLATFFSLELSTEYASDLKWIPRSRTPIDKPGGYCSDITSSHIPRHVTAKQKATARSVIANGGRADETETLLPSVLHWFERVSGYFLVLCDSLKKLDECLSDRTPSPYVWIQCTEWGGFYTGYIAGSPDRPEALSIATTLQNPTWYIERCRKTYNFSSSYHGPDLERVNKYGGVNLSAPRLILSTGSKDVWRGLTPLAEQLPASTQPNPRVQNNGTTDSPQIIMAGAGHEWDLDDIPKEKYTDAVPPPVVRDAQALEIKTVQNWLVEWKDAHC
ncbi:uncharacterized protein LTR77_005981 [Saxophila tyrrhenica]|uniref:Uncharacterized protein n=1 Tax=Saxophila tyrrhenica TaxID=1690608 RepID=A0AAV9P776_9PEZI|nr:hypothetical protein LTR77_005981 [Saxophila tyrrhenica]